MRTKPLTDIPELDNSKCVTANGDDLNCLGYTDANFKFQGHIDCNSKFLVVPKSRCDSVLIGTQFMSLLDGKDMENNDGYLVKNLMNNYNIIWSSKRICKLAKSSTKLDTAYLRVKPAFFARTVLLTQTDKAESIKWTYWL